MRISSSQNRRVFAIAWPMTIASSTVPLLGLVDTAILGHLDHPRYLAAVAAGGSIMTFIGWLFAFLRMGNTGLTAQASGSGDTDRNREILFQSAGLGLLLGAALILLHTPLLHLAVALIKPSPDVQLLTYEYCRIRIFAAPATFFSFAAIGWLLGNQRARACLVILVVTNMANIALDFVFIVGLKMNSAGAAWASFVAEWAGAALAAALIARTLPKFRLPSSLKTTFQLRRMQALFTVNQHLFLRTCCIVFTMAFFHAQGARQGDSVLAANAIMMQLLLLVAYTQDGFAHAAEALSGHAIGEGRTGAFYEIVLITLLWSLGLAVLATLVLWQFPAEVLHIFTDLPNVTIVALEHWAWLVALPMAGVVCFVADGVFIGANKTSDMLHSTLAATLLIFLPIWWLPRPLGNDGLWLAYVSFLGSRSLLMGVLFFRHAKNRTWGAVEGKPADLS